MLDDARPDANADVLVLGGTGELGSEVVKALRAAGARVTVMARPTSDRDRLAGLDVSYAVGDLLVETDVQRVFTDASYKVVVDASSGPWRGMENATDELLTAQTFYEQSQRHVSKWAAATGVEHVILHSTVGAGDSADLVNVEKTFEVQRLALESKSNAEQSLMDSGVPYTIIRHLTLLPLEMKESGAARLSQNLTEVGAVTRDGLARLTLDCMNTAASRNVIYHAMDDGLDLPDDVIAIWKLALKPAYMPAYVRGE